MLRNIWENELEQLAKCPLMTGGELPSDRQLIAERVIRDAIEKSFNGDPPSRSVMREKYTTYWKYTYYKEYEGSPVPLSHPTFWKGPRVSRGVATRISKLLNSFEILQPVFPYTLNSKSGNVNGSYSLLRRKKDKDNLRAKPEYYVLRVHESAPRYRQHPDVISIVRWLHASRSINPKWLGIYHLPLLAGDPWISPSLNKSLGEIWIENIIIARNFPSPGPHCEHCSDKQCEIIYER
jgi:hypothetical protein